MSAKSEQLEQELEEERAEDEVCASCGITAVDDVTLKDCNDGCDLVKYCSNKCQVNHREQHDEECKIRKAELHDKELFTQPDISHLGECPICFLPMSIYPKNSTMMSCCCKLICRGCNIANKIREIEAELEHRCAFCREPAPNSEEEVNKRVMKRIKKKDPAAMVQMGKKHAGKEDYRNALEYYTKAAELGDAEAHACLGMLYFKGEGVERDMTNAVYHYEQAAIGGNPAARVLLALYESNNGRFERAAKHYIINANLGCNLSLKEIKDLFVKGIVSKEEYAAALRAHQAAVDATKSAEREKAEAFHEFRKQHLDGAK